MSESELIGLISEGEGNRVEFKLRFIEPDIGKALVAFANGSGGVVLFGVGDNGAIIGLTPEEVKEVHKRLVAVAARILPPEQFQVGARQIGDKWVAYIRIEALPDYLRPATTSSGEVYVRDGGVNRIQRTPPVSTTALEGEHKRARLFVAMSFRSEEEPALEDYYRAMDRAARRSGVPVNLQRMDFTEGDYEISQKIMDEIDAADIVLADYTLNSANVYFEVGYARGKKRRVIQTARKGTMLEFDVRTWRTLFYKNATELEERLVAAIADAYHSCFPAAP